MGALTHNGEVLQSLPANASQINFDKTGTDLNATQVENAIKEVNGKVNTNAEDITQLKSGLTNGLVFEPYGAQPPSSNPFDENGSGYVLNVVYHGTALGYVILRPKNFADGSGRHNAIELYDTSWNLIWRVLRSDT